MEDEKSNEENNNDENNASWWGWSSSWIQSAKEKSSSALEFMKRDLTEFKQVVQTDAVAAVSSTAALLKDTLTIDTAEAVAGKAKQSITTVIGSIAEAFTPQKELEDTELLVIRNSEPVALDWWQSQLYLIRKDSKTFCHEPEGPPEMYENWLESFDLSDHQEEMTEIMMTCSETRTLYDKLVPSSVSHLEFWQRYFYRVHLLRKAEAKRTDLMRRAEQVSIEDIEWEKETEKITDSHLAQKVEEARIDPASKRVPSVLSANDQKTSESLSEKPDSTSELNATNSADVKGRQTSKSTSDKNIKSSVQQNSTAKVEGDLPSTGEDRSSPIESLKGSSTSEEWEKDFDLELNETDLKSMPVTTAQDSQKEEDDDWEKWQ